jgi:hypothetical protein
MDPVTVAVALLRLVLELVGHEQAKALLSQEAINRANAEADAIEAARGLK